MRNYVRTALLCSLCQLKQMLFFGVEKTCNWTITLTTSKYVNLWTTWKKMQL